VTLAIGGGTNPLAAKADAVDPKDDAKKAAQQLEAFFLRKLLAEAIPEGSQAMGGAGAATFRGMFDEALADQIAGSGQLGLADQFATQLAKDPKGGGAGAAIDALAGRTALHPGLQPMALPAGMHPANAAHAAHPGERVGGPVTGAHFASPLEHTSYSSGFGMRMHPIKHVETMHAGLDLRAKTGTPVGAAAAGTVVRAEAAGGYGNLVVIRHPDGLETRYAHLSAIEVKKGDEVAVGQQVGQVGSTGQSTGPHLHFEVRKDGKPIDPRPLLDQTGTRSNQ
jgi:murein DD-endopeptidase MepM/ murein hydrolase activator NlpD